MKNIYADLVERLKRDETVALATIIETRGSTPQVPGASALFSPAGLAAGTLGGGWVEAAAQKKILSALDTGSIFIAEFSLQAGVDVDAGAICGGEIRILIDTSPSTHLDIFEALLTSIELGRSGILATVISPAGTDEVTLARHWLDTRTDIDNIMQSTSGLHEDTIKKALSAGRPTLVQTKKELFFLEPVSPNPRLVIVGAGHIGRAVTHLGSLLDFEVTVIDDRPEFANKEILQDADRIIVDTAENALEMLPKTPDSYFVIVTRGHLQDADALRRVIASDAAYIGMIGSRRKVALMREKFMKEGWATREQFDRVHAPIGIDISSETVEEIAISIAAELIRERRANT
jgi:xanthine dehydrogenase accessory factor